MATDARLANSQSVTLGQGIFTDWRLSFNWRW